MNATLVERVKVLASQRRAESELAALLKAKRDEFDAAQADLIQAVRNARAAVNDSELMVRALAVDAYRANEDDTTPAPGIGIRVTKEYSIDAVAGLAWAKEKQMCLVPESLDTAAVKKIAAATPLSFVTITREPSATIATDLDKALAAEAATESAAVSS